jgi:hypothetical protein
MRYFRTITDPINRQFYDYYRTENTTTQHQTLYGIQALSKILERQFREPRDNPHGK